MDGYTCLKTLWADSKTYFSIVTWKITVVQFDTANVSRIVHIVCGSDKKVMMSSACLKLKLKRKSVLTGKHVKILCGFFKTYPIQMKILLGKVRMKLHRKGERTCPECLLTQWNCSSGFGSRNSHEAHALSTLKQFLKCICF